MMATPAVSGSARSGRLRSNWTSHDRTVRRWIEKELLIAHRIAGVVRIAEGDFRAFLAAHRDN